MFATACIPMVISKATLKREMDDEEAYRVADIALLIEPFSRELADELGTFVAAHLFDDAGDVRPELADISLGLRESAQRLIVASAPDSAALATLRDVRIGDLSVTRKQKGDSRVVSGRHRGPDRSAGARDPRVPVSALRGSALLHVPG